MLPSSGAKATAARLALERGVLAAMRPIERVFCYLPFEHSESLTDQDYYISAPTVDMLEADGRCFATQVIGAVSGP